MLGQLCAFLPGINGDTGRCGIRAWFQWCRLSVGTTNRSLSDCGRSAKRPSVRGRCVGTAPASAKLQTWLILIICSSVQRESLEQPPAAARARSSPVPVPPPADAFGLRGSTRRLWDVPTEINCRAEKKMPINSGATFTEKLFRRAICARCYAYEGAHERPANPEGHQPQRQ